VNATGQGHSLFSMVILLILSGGGCSSKLDTDQLHRETRQLYETALPIIAEYRVEGYTYSDNCIAIGYAEGVFASRPDATICRVLFRSRPERLTTGALKDVQHVHAAVTNASSKVGTVRDVQYVGGVITRAVFDYSHGWTRLYLVYEPNYDLPTSVPGEIDYTAIDGNWFAIREDFN
jgi:hypothetical protein